MIRFSAQVEDTLRRAGWRPGRQVPNSVGSWKENLMLSDGFEMFESRGRGFGTVIVEVIVRPDGSVSEARQNRLFLRRQRKL